jgi:hypothetical protein
MCRRKDWIVQEPQADIRSNCRCLGLLRQVGRPQMTNSTDPTGRSFVSYRRVSKNDVGMLVSCQNENGVPTWQDVRNLGDGPTEDQIAAVLLDASTANAVLWLTPEVANSSFIKKVEVPHIVTRYDAGDGFFVTTVAAGGLTYNVAAEIIRGHAGIHDVSKWNIHRAGEPMGLTDALVVTRQILKSRIQAINRSAPPDNALRIRLHVRQPAPFQLGYALSLDWSHAFEGRHAEASVWNERLLPALEAVVATTEQAAPGRRIIASGFPTISAAVALGATCLAPRQVDIAWLQFTTGSGEQEWSLKASTEPSHFSSTVAHGSTDSDEVAVLVSVADDAVPAFAASRRELPEFRAVLNIARKDVSPPHVLESPRQALDLAHIIVRAIRTTRQDLKLLGGVHLFMAVPVGMAMLVGQLLNTLGEVQVYEHHAVDGVGRYQHELTLRPSG